MPLLRLTSLIVATLLVAAMSAFVPGTKDHGNSISHQSPAAPATASLAIAGRAPEAAWTQVQGVALRTPYAKGFTQVSGQSIPEAGQ